MSNLIKTKKFNLKKNNFLMKQIVKFLIFNKIIEEKNLVFKFVKILNF